MPSCSNTSHDCCNLHQSCVPDLYHTTEWLFSGRGELLPPKGGSSRCTTTLNEEYKGRVTYCSPLASVVCKLLDFNLLLWNHLANWNRAWFPTKFVLLFQKRVFPYYIWILIMSPLRTKGDIHCFSLIFFFRFCFFSAKLVRTISFFSFQIGQWYLICGCMTIRRCVAYRNDLRGTFTFDLKVK